MTTVEAMMAAKVLIFAGSTRHDSVNRKLADNAARWMKDNAVEHTLLELSDYPMPIYNGDQEAEEGVPDTVVGFKDALIGHSHWVIVSPEYNSSFSPLLKNVIDWASRSTVQDEAPLSAFRGKTAAILSASPGALGGMRGLVMLRMLLSNMGVTVQAEQMTLGQAFSQFDDHGVLQDEAKQQQLEAVLARLILRS